MLINKLEQELLKYDEGSKEYQELNTRICVLRSCFDSIISHAEKIQKLWRSTGISDHLTITITSDFRSVFALDDNEEYIIHDTYLEPEEE